MIRHRPAGIGHPYRIEIDQRHPVIPVVGEPLELRASTPRETTEMCVEVEAAGIRTLLAAERLAPPALAAASGGHLAVASDADGSRRRQGWSARVISPKDRFRYRFHAHGRATRWFSTESARWSSGGGLLEVGGERSRFEPESVAWLLQGGRAVRVRFALRLDPADHVVGFGERFDALDQRGRCLDATVFEQYKQQGNRTYLPMPFAIVVGGSGWGFHVQTFRRTYFDIGASDPDRLWITADLDPSGSEDHLAVHVFKGTPAQVLAAFLERAGRPVLPPAWVFEPWMSGNEWNSQERVLAEVRRSLELDIPAGVVVIEAWSDECTFTAFRDARYAVKEDGAPHRLADFEFPPDGAWPDPKSMVDELHGLGLRVLLWQIPLQKARPAPRGQAKADRDRMLRSGYGVRTPRGAYRNRGWWFPQSLLVDFTNPEAKEWWLSKRRWLVEDLGIDGFKTDGGEHAWGEELRYADGSRGVAGNNRYPVLYQAAYQELLKAAGKPAVTFSRAGFTGAQAYPCHWAGDEDSTWEAFRASITAGLTAGSCGIFFWGWDLAGFSGEIPDAELYLRATAMACFCPIMQYHSEFNRHRLPCRDRTPWNVAERTSDDRILPIFRKFAHLRRRLIPYLLKAAEEAIRTGRPVMRPMFFDQPLDERVWDWPFQYHLGPDLLVAAVTEPGADKARVYVPNGTWVNAWTAEPIAGPEVVEVDARLDTIPLFVRAPSWADLRHIFSAELEDADGLLRPGRRRGIVSEVAEPG